MVSGPKDLPRLRPMLDRVHRAVVREASSVAGAPLVELLLASAASGSRWESAAFSASGLSRAERAELSRELIRSPATRELPEPRRLGEVRVATCEAALARLIGGRGLKQVFLAISSGSSPFGWLRVVVERRPDRVALKAYRGLARQVSGRLEAEALRSELASRHQRAALDVRREKRALAELSQAKDTLGALNLAGTHLMVETDGRAILGVICRELIRLGFHSAVLTAEHTPAGPRPPYRFAFSSFSEPLQRATERVLGYRLSDLGVDPGRAPLVARVLRQGRTVYTARAPEVARQLFGATAEQVRKLGRLLGLRHVVVAPLRYDEGISGLLVVAAARLRKSDPEGIDAFALQASIALEKARLFSELRAQQARLESEVERRTQELTRAVRALKELDRRKDNFLANISHELRTPLVTVLGYADLLLSGKLGDLTTGQRDSLRVVATSGRRLRSFIEELLEYSRYELTREKLSFSPVEMPELVHQAAMALAPSYQERGLILRSRVHRGTPRAWGDRERLLQVLMNLLSNAERYCAEGGHVRVAVAGGPAGLVELSVSDDGQGIPPEHLERIFDRLYQVGDVVKQRQKGAGLGLGLAIVKSIVDAHGGHISVSSRVGRGTRFHLSLPRATPEAKTAPAAPDEVGTPALS
ncbi:MAG TPA: HAMP domain-containing sensor histidine kinase [Anaeromyxobacteraceae bacterium]|nr:HAMP domain-containing sensor histidine kinase [Anaeromyxobacteraceae bacterium]